MIHRFVLALLLVITTFIPLAAQPQWNLKPIGDESEYAISMSFVDAANGYVITGVRLPEQSLTATYSMVMRTSDGGDSWSLLRRDTNASFRMVEAPSVATVYAVAARDSIIRSTDGGSSWTDVSPPGVTRVDGIDFADDRNGFIIGEGFVGRTTNGGETWTIDRSFAGTNLGSVHIAGPNRSYVAGVEANGPAGRRFVFASSTDGGASWTRTYPSEGIVGANSATDLDFIDDEHGFLVVNGDWNVQRGGLDGGLFATTDGGATWRAIVLSEFNLFLTAAAFADERVGYVLGDDLRIQSHPGVLLRTEDGGESWSAIRFDHTLADVVFVDGAASYAVGNDGARAVLLELEETSAVVVGTRTGTRIRAYPNPTRDLVTVECSDMKANATVRLLDCLGRTIVERHCASGGSGCRLLLDLGLLPVGVYLVEIADDGEVRREILHRN